MYTYILKCVLTFNSNSQIFILSIKENILKQWISKQQSDKVLQSNKYQW